MSANVTQMDTNTFQRTVDSSSVVIVDFYAEWCGPCKMVAPIMEKLAEDYKGAVEFVKLDVDANPTIAEEFDVASIPTLIIFRNGKPADRIVGAWPCKPLPQQNRKGASLT